VNIVCECVVWFVFSVCLCCVCYVSVLCGVVCVV